MIRSISHRNVLIDNAKLLIIRILFSMSSFFSEYFSIFSFFFSHFISTTNRIQIEYD